MRLPKAKPDQIIIHRIEFQETEREILKSAMTAYSFRNATKGIFNLTSDLTTVVLLIIAVEYVFKITILDDVLLGALGLGTATTASLATALAESWANYRQSQEYGEDYHEQATSVAGGLRNMFDNLIGLFTGEYMSNLEDYRREQDA
jgi:hypothetical protein